MRSRPGCRSRWQKMPRLSAIGFRRIAADFQNSDVAQQVVVEHRQPARSVLR